MKNLEQDIYASTEETVDTTVSEEKQEEQETPSPETPTPEEPKKEKKQDVFVGYFKIDDDGAIETPEGFVVDDPIILAEGEEEIKAYLRSNDVRAVSLDLPNELVNSQQKKDSGHCPQMKLIPRQFRVQIALTTLASIHAKMRNG